MSGWRFGPASSTESLWGWGEEAGQGQSEFGIADITMGICTHCSPFPKSKTGIQGLAKDLASHPDGRYSVMGTFSCKAIGDSRTF